MKNKLLNIFILLLLCFPLYAENITKEEAKQRALEFFNKNVPTKSITQVDLIYEGKPNVKSASSTPSLYIFDNPYGKGFVIISGDDIAYPVLGYSFDNEFPKDMPENVEGWINGLEESINYARNIGYKVTTQNQTKSFTASAPVVSLTTAKWDQGSPYNQFTPTVNGQKTPIGCTATAAGIIMYYHKYPAAGRGIIPGYVSNETITINAKALGHAYDWNNMLPEYVNGQYTDQQAKNVAELLYEIGIALKSDYSPGATGALPNYVTPALSKHFKYCKDALFCMKREYPIDDWHKMLKKEMNENRPVFYSGHSQEGGHAFVLDGYTNDNYYSVNWGWSGSYNGYFLINALQPSGSGIGGNNSHFNDDQGCIINLRPEDNGEYIAKLAYSGGGLKVKLENGQVIQKGVQFKLIIEFLLNSGNTEFTGQYIIGLTNSKGDIKEILGVVTIDQLNVGYGYSGLTIKLTITEDIKPGDRIRGFYQIRGESEYNLIKGGEECTWEIIVKEGEEETDATLAESTSITFNKENKVLTINTLENVEIKLLSSNNTDLSSNCNKQGNTITISTANLPSDTYMIELKRGDEMEQVKVKLN